MPPLDPQLTQILPPLRGHGELVGKAYDSIGEDLLNLALQAMGCPEEAEDVVQEIFLFALENKAKWPAELALSDWLLMLFHRRLGQQKQHLQVSIQLNGHADEIPTRRWEPLSQLQQEEFSQQIDTAIQLLPESYREVVILGVQGGRSSQEIGRILGRPPTTVRSQLARGLDRLRRVLPPALGALAAYGVQGSAGANSMAAGAAFSAARERWLVRAASLAPPAATGLIASTPFAWKWAALVLACISPLVYWAMLPEDAPVPQVHAQTESLATQSNASQGSVPMVPVSLEPSRVHAGSIPEPSAALELAQAMGKVVDPDGAPIPRAEVRLFTWNDWDSQGDTPEIYDEDRFGWITHTDAAGEFRFEVPLPDKEDPVLSVNAGAGFTQEYIFFNSAHSNQEPLRPGLNPMGSIRLDRAGKLSGVLLDEFGQPAFPAEIVLMPGIDSGSMIATKPDGSFEANHIPAGPQRLAFLYKNQVRMRRDVTIDVGQATQLPRVQLSQDPSLQVFVQDEHGNPIPGVRVRHNPMPGHPDRGMGELGLATDANGQVTILTPNLPQHVLYVSHREHVAAKPFYLIPAGKTELRVTMKRTWKQGFRALRAGDRTPLAEFELRRIVRLQGQWIDRGYMDLIPMDSDSAKTISTNDGEWVRVSSQGYQSKNVNPRAVEGPIADVLLKPLQTITCRILVKGRPLVDTEVEILAGVPKPTKPGQAKHFLGKDYDCMWIRTDARGRAQWKAFANPDYQYRILTRANGELALEHWFNPQDFQGATVDLGDLEVQPAGSLHARIIVPEGTSPAGLSMTLDSRRSATSVQSDSDGTFTLTGISPGPHSLFLTSRRGFAQKPIPFTFHVDAGVTTELEIDLRPLTYRQVSLALSYGGHPTEGFKVFLLKPSFKMPATGKLERSAFFGITDANGLVHGKTLGTGPVNVWAIPNQKPFRKLKGPGPVNLVGQRGQPILIDLEQTE